MSLLLIIGPSVIESQSEFTAANLDAARTALQALFATNVSQTNELFKDGTHQAYMCTYLTARRIFLLCDRDFSQYARWIQ